MPPARALVLEAHPYDDVVWIYDHGSSPIKGAGVIAHTSIGGSDGLHTVTIVMAPRQTR